MIDRLLTLTLVMFSLSVNVFSVSAARAQSVTYSYEGNSFVEFEGEPGVFSTGDKVHAKFILDCAAAHPEANCNNLPFANYVELGAVHLEPFDFSAGPARLPTSDGSVEIAQFEFSTDASARIVDWNMDLGFPDASGFINVDTDNAGEGLDSAAALGGGALVVGNPGSWSNGLPPLAEGLDVEVRKSVDNPTPTGPQQTVEFTVEVRNIGDEPANEVVVEDKLPPELSIPEGMAAFTSMGYYDPSTGRWEIGELEPGLPPEILTIPAVITSELQPVCVVNTATSNVPGDGNPDNDSAFSTLRRPDIARCVDLGLTVLLSDAHSVECQATGYIRYQLEINNVGPEIARNVFLEISETKYEAPGFSIKNPAGCQRLGCAWEAIESGQTIRMDISSETFQVQQPTEHALRAVIRSDVEDYNAENNTLVEEITIQPFSEEPCEITRGGGGMDFSGVGGGGCFIATSVYGSADHPYVKTLRDFRDSVMLKTALGRDLVDFYYRHSPDLACYIEESNILKLIVRGLLLPIVLTITYPWQVLLVLVVVVAALLVVRHRVKT